MSTICAEVLKSYQVTNPATVSTLLAIAAEPEFNHITVFNNTDVDLKVAYTNKQGSAADFIVPKDRVFTRKINGSLMNTSLYLQALAPATGKVTINIGN